MRAQAPFQPDDLRDLDAFYDSADLILAMEDVFHGYAYHRGIAVRHDCDNVILPAVHMAEWEAERGYRSTYYILHTAPYWQDKPLLRSSLERIAELGHEIGIHNDAITASIQTKRDPFQILDEAIDELRGYGHTIRSTVAHGHALCRTYNYVNDEMFSGCYRDDYGPITRLGLMPRPMFDLGLEFDANWLPRGDYLSDSGGRWSQPFDAVTQAWPAKGQLHILQHPDHWAEAFVPEKAAA